MNLKGNPIDSTQMCWVEKKPQVGSKLGKTLVQIGLKGTDRALEKRGKMNKKKLKVP